MKVGFIFYSTGDQDELQKSDSVGMPHRRNSTSLARKPSDSSQGDNKSTAIRGAAFDWSTVRVLYYLDPQTSHFAVHHN